MTKLRAPAMLTASLRFFGDTEKRAETKELGDDEVLDERQNEENSKKVLTTHVSLSPISGTCHEAVP